MQRTARGRGAWQAVLHAAPGGDSGGTAGRSAVVCVGRRDAGRIALVRALQSHGAGRFPLAKGELLGGDDDGNGDGNPIVPNAACGVDYAFLHVRSPEDDRFALADCWITRPDLPDAAALVREYVTPQLFGRLAFLVLVDLSTPWAIRRDLQEGLAFVTDFAQHMLSNLNPDEQDQWRNQFSRYTQSYRAMVEGHKNGKVGSNHTDDDFRTTSALEVNLGAPIIVVGTKADTLKALESRDHPGRADVLQAHLRDMLVSYGAALVYTCTKDPASTRNIGLLYEYLMHRLYDFPFEHAPNWTPADAIFIPGGWDSSDEIREFARTTITGGDLSQPLELSMPPEPIEVSRGGSSDQFNGGDEEGDALGDGAVQVQPMNAFLADLVHERPELLAEEVAESKEEASPPPVSTSRKGALLTTSRSARSGTRGGEVGGTTTRRGRLDAPPANGAPPDNESLRQFFHQLLSAKSPAPTPRVPREGPGKTRRSPPTGSPKSVSGSPPGGQSPPTGQSPPGMPVQPT